MALKRIATSPQNRERKGMPTLIALTDYAGGGDSGAPVWVNADRIVTMKRVLGYLQATEYTAVHLTDGFKLDVIETPEQVL
jgi:hypothetical protein